MTEQPPKPYFQIPGSLEARDHRSLWHPFTAMHEWMQSDPLIIESGCGVRVRDIHGREYYDGNSSLWVNIHGHRHPRIDAAIRAQLDRIAHSTMLGLSNPLAIDLSERLLRIAPAGLSRVFYSDSGSEAVEIALKIAFQHWKLRGEESRNSYLTLTNGYHGDTLGAVSVGGIHQFHTLFKPLLFQAHWSPSPGLHQPSSGEPIHSRPSSSVINRSNYPPLSKALDSFVQVLSQHAPETAAVIVEPLIQAAGGMVLMPPGFLKGVEEACRRWNVLLIVDEVATGFGRTGKMFACEHEDVHPDLMCIAKGLTGGYLPLAATLVTEAVFAPFGSSAPGAVFYHGHSYTGNALACAAALANLEVFEEERTLENLPPKLQLIAQKLDSFARLEHVSSIRQLGMIVGIELVMDQEQGLPYPAEWRMGARACSRARDLGMITRPLGDVVVFLPPLCSSLAELEEMLNILYQTIVDVTERPADG